MICMLLTASTCIGWLSRGFVSGRVTTGTFVQRVNIAGIRLKIYSRERLFWGGYPRGVCQRVSPGLGSEEVFLWWVRWGIKTGPADGQPRNEIRQRTDEITDGTTAMHIASFAYIGGRWHKKVLSKH